MLKQATQLKGQSETKLYNLLVFSPIVLVVALIACIYYIPAVQNVFLSLFYQVKECIFKCGSSFAEVSFITFLGFAMIVLMMPFAFYEFAVGFSCGGWLLPIAIVTIAKITGEITSFYIGRYLARVLKPILEEFRFYNVIQKLTEKKPFKTQLLMRLSGITPQLIMNYGMGVIGNVKFSTFILVANLSGIPSTIMAVFIGKQLNTLHGIIYQYLDIFANKRNTEDVEFIELFIVALAACSVGVLVYYVGREYNKILDESYTDLNKDLDQTMDTIDMELANAL